MGPVVPKKRRDRDRSRSRTRDRSNSTGDAEERERKEEANKASSASRVAHLDKLVAHWDAMGLRSAAGCRVTSPVSLPRIGMALYELPSLFPSPSFALPPYPAAVIGSSDVRGVSETFKAFYPFIHLFSLSPQETLEILDPVH